jgi:uncharacterized membrane protein YbhN (UPF0104 family)
VLWAATGAPGSGPAASARSALRRLPWSTLLRLAGAAAGLALLGRCVDLRGAAGGLGSAHRGWLALGGGLAVAAFLTAILEWGVWLRAASRGVTWRMVSSWQAQSVFLSAFLPTGAGGDALRVVKAMRAAGCGRGLASLLGSRLAGTTGMAAWGLVGALIMLPQGRVGGMATLVALASVGVLAAAWAVALTAGPLVRRLGTHRHRLLRVLATRARPLTDALHWYGGRRGVVAASLAAGAVGWGLHLLSLDALGRAIGVEVSPALFALVIPVALLAALAPFTVNGVGVREGVLVGLLMHNGVDAHRATALALLIDLQTLPVTLLGAALWFSRRSGPAS